MPKNDKAGSPGQGTEIPLKGSDYKVLDSGFIKVIDIMGDDSSIVQAARVSYGKGTKKLSQDRGLIRYLMRHRHTTPFEMCEIKLLVRVPMDTWRQWIRHRTANVNEYSTRYSIAIDDKAMTGPEEWRTQSGANRQGSGEYLDADTGRKITQAEQDLHEHAQKVYKDRIEAGVAREQARKDLPLSTYTEAYWKIDLHNLLHFVSLRMDDHAQWEIRQYARVLGHEIVARWVPLTWEAFLDYHMNATLLTALEKDVIRFLNSGQPDDACRYLEGKGLYELGDKGLKRNRERDEMEQKLRDLGYTIPW
ncbi:FAD-dependent thymidylate synthase [Candidatus Neomarinimicrobiota bacterium]